MPTFPTNLKKAKTFDQRIKSGELTDIRTAARLVGYSEGHLRRLCHQRAVGHERRNGSEFFFTKEHLDGLFTTLRPSSVSTVKSPRNRG